MIFGIDLTLLLPFIAVGFAAQMVDGALGMAFGVAVRIAQVFWACFGLASYLWLTTRQAGAVAGRPWTSMARVATPATDLQQSIRGQRSGDPSDAVR